MQILVGRALDDDRVVLERHLHRRVQLTFELALRTLHVNLVAINFRGDSLGEWHRVLSNS
jgi:hypothetical protein